MYRDIEENNGDSGGMEYAELCKLSCIQQHEESFGREYQGESG